MERLPGAPAHRGATSAAGSLHLLRPGLAGHAEHLLHKVGAALLLGRAQDLFKEMLATVSIKKK